MPIIPLLMAIRWSLHWRCYGVRSLWPPLFWLSRWGSNHAPIYRRYHDAVLGGFAAQVPTAALRYRADLIRSSRSVWGMDAPVATFAGQIHQESQWRANARLQSVHKG